MTGENEVSLWIEYDDRLISSLSADFLVNDTERKKIKPGGVDGFDQGESCRERDDGCEVPLRLFAA